MAEIKGTLMFKNKHYKRVPFISSFEYIFKLIVTNA